MKTRQRRLEVMARWTSQADMPKWLECFMETRARPWVRARVMQWFMPLSAAMKPKALWASTFVLSVICY